MGEAALRVPDFFHLNPHQKDMGKGVNGTVAHVLPDLFTIQVVQSKDVTDQDLYRYEDGLNHLLGFRSFFERNRAHLCRPSFVLLLNAS